MNSTHVTISQLRDSERGRHQAKDRQQLGNGSQECSRQLCIMASCDLYLLVDRYPWCIAYNKDNTLMEVTPGDFPTLPQWEIQHFMMLIELFMAVNEIWEPDKTCCKCLTHASMPVLGTENLKT